MAISYLERVTGELVVYPEVVVLPETVTSTDEESGSTSTVKAGGSIDEAVFDCSKVSLRKNSTDTDGVRKLQTILKARGFYTRQVDGQFGKYTKLGVEKLQKSLGVTVDGYFGPVTCKKLQQTSTTSNAATHSAGKKNKSFTIRDMKVSPSISCDLEGLSDEITVNVPFDEETWGYLRQLQKTEYRMASGNVVMLTHKGYINSLKTVYSDGVFLIEIGLIGYNTFLDQSVSYEKTAKRSVLLKELIELAGLKANIDMAGLVDDEFTVKAVESSSGTGSGGGLVEVNGNDCTETSLISARSYDIDTCHGNTKIGKTSANYAQDTKGMSAKEALYDIIDRFHYGPSLTSSRRYDNNKRCPQQMWTKTGKFWGNCADISRLVKAMMEVHGLKCGIRHAPSHYYNLIEVDGKVYKFDCCFSSGYTGRDYGSELCNNLTKNGGPWQR